MANDFTGPGDFTAAGVDAPGTGISGTQSSGTQSSATQSSATQSHDGSDKAKAWIAADKDAPPGCGRVMLTRPGGAADEPDPVAAVPAGFSFLMKMFGVLAPDSPTVAGNIAIKSKSAANDNSYWVGDENGDGGGVYGSDVDVATLADGSSVVAWIGADRIVHAKCYASDADAQGAGAEESAARTDHSGQINSLLADLGGAGQRAGNAEGRVKVSAYGQGGFAALWIADFGFTAALMGKLYMLQQDPAGDAGTGLPGTQATGWTVKDVSPVAVPRFASNISIEVSDDGRVSVGYQSEPGDGGSMFAVTVVNGDSGEGQLLGSDGDDLLTPEGEIADLQVPHGSSAPVTLQNVSADSSASGGDGGTRDTGSAAGEAAEGNAAGPILGSSLPDLLGDIELTGTPIVVAGGANNSIAQMAPQVVVTENGNIAILHVSAGEKPGTSVIEVGLFESDGTPVVGSSGAPATAVVARDAIIEVAERPNLQLGPSISTAGDNVVVAFVSNLGDGDHKNYQLNLQLINSDGELASDAPVAVALTAEPETTYSDFATAGYCSHSNKDQSPDSTIATQGITDEAGNLPAPETVSAAEAPVTETAQVAIVWVENADASGYGSIMGQRFSVVSTDDDSQGNGSSGDNSGPGNSGDNEGDGDGGLVLVALGRDGSASSSDGESDAPFHLQFDSTGDVVGRAPQVAGYGDDGIAVAWVQETSPGSGVEVVAGEVLQLHGGTSMLAINLTGLISNGIVHGTEPSLLSDDQGDIVIGWVQNNANGQYEAAAAVYRALATGGWAVPDAVLVLQTFNSAPTNLDFGLQGGDDPTILLSWSSSGSRVSGARFDLDGNQEGSVFRISGDDNDTGNEGDLSVAGLADGRIVVVYTQADGDDTDISAMIVQTAPSSVPGNSGDDSSVSDNSGSGGSGSELRDQSQDSASQAVAVIVTTPSDTSSTANNVSGYTGTTTSLVVVDFDNDSIRVIDVAAGNVAGAAASSANGSGSSGSGSESSDSGSGSSNSGSGNGHDDVDYDNLAFGAGFGNDIADYHEDEHVFDVEEPVADMFDALQFANALGENGNGEVLVFEASNLVVIRDFETL